MDIHADAQGDYVGIDVYEHPYFYNLFNEVHIVGGVTQLWLPLGSQEYQYDSQD